MKNSPNPSDKNLAQDSAVAKIHELATSIRVCLFGTSEGHVPLEFRPMSVQHVDAVGNVWFLSARSSSQNSQISRHPQVQLLFANPGKSEYLSLLGRAFISDSPALREKYWSPLAEAWFTKGVNDPELTVIRVQPDHGHYWDTEYGKTITLLQVAVGALTGKPSGAGVSGEVWP
ncbi:MAG: pyridoxamine 5'-phosphate oxidase family protein [Opitutaceae bacterium]